VTPLNRRRLEHFRARKRGMVRPMYFETSLCRSERQAAYSGVLKILATSRGLASSCQDSIWNSDEAVPEMKGAWMAAAIFPISPSNSTSGGLWSK